MNCYSIPAEVHFSGTLARWILGRYGSAPAILTRALILLPNRRSCRALREAFLEAASGEAMLLPRIQPLGDIEDETALAHEALNPGIPAALSPVRRHMLLTRLVMRSGGKPYPAPQAAQLARQLAALIDDVTRAGLDFGGLARLVPEDLATHWQQTLDFLSILSRHWPLVLQAEGAADPAQYRNLLLLAAAKAWRESPPPYPVIAAGSTGSIPATAELLAAVARLPQGAVVLPGLDTEMPEDEWEMLGETHPQYGLRQLLESMGCERAAVGILSGAVGQGARAACLRAILHAPEATARWAGEQLPLEEGLKGVRLLAADTLLDEARMIAVALREVLETPGKTAALVTPDRSLARMVAAQMQRFGVAIDDSAGRPLIDTPPGYFMRLAAEMAASRAAPAALLSVLRHPLAAAGLEPAECRRLSRSLEVRLLRGVRREAGLEPLAGAARNEPEIYPLVQALAHHMQAFAGLLARAKASMTQLLATHIAFAEWLASTPGEKGEDRLWRGAAGNQLASALAELMQHGDLLGEIEAASYPALLDTLLAGQVYRPRWGLHPRLHILSPIEARLQRFDRLILGSLNEGMWPAAAVPDPWMSRPMRESFGLPSAERAIGQSAHDVMMLACAPEVLLTRARKVEGAPTVPSRWLVRLETLVSGLDKEVYRRMQAQQDFENACRFLDTPLGYASITRPQPAPPLESRPRRLRVTAIDTWLRDPYMIYARHILRLKPLSPLDEEPDAADFGTVVHAALEAFTRAWPRILPNKPYDALLTCGREAFAPFLNRPGVACLWWPRFEAMAGWLIDREKERRGEIAQVAGELTGEWHFHVDGKPFALTTRIDRLEIRRDGTLTLADYKTGALPADIDIERGLANQLFLEALITSHGALQSAIPPGGIISGLEYWRLAGNVEQCEIKSIKPDGIAPARERLEQLIRRFDDAATPYSPPLDPSLILRYSDYEHLTRRNEWEAV